jgi:hypothetical protein
VDVWIDNNSPGGWPISTTAPESYALGQQHAAQYDSSRREEDFEAASHYFTAAIKQWQYDQGLSLWSEIHLAIANLNLASYNAAGRIADAKLAEQYYQAALAAAPRDLVPVAWAWCMSNLGELYSRRFEVENRERSRVAAEEQYRQALEVYTEEAYPAQWAMLQHDTGNLYFKMYERMGREGDALRAERHFLAAFRVRARYEGSRGWAMSQYALGILYSMRYNRTEAAEDAARAQQRLRQALLVYSRDTASLEYRKANHALGVLLKDLFTRGGSDEDANAAIGHLRTALEGLTPQQEPLFWGMAQFSQGSLFTEFYRRSVDEMVAELAIGYFEQALQVYKRETVPLDWARTQDALGNLYVQRFAYTDKAEYAETAEGHLRNAFAVQSEAGLTMRAQETMWKLARLFGLKEDWVAAHNICYIVLLAAREELLAAATEVEQRQVLARQAAIYKFDAYALVRQGRLAEAMVRFDEGRARGLVRIMSREDTMRRLHGDEGIRQLEGADARRKEAEAALWVASRAVEVAGDNERPSAIRRREETRKALTLRIAALELLVRDLHLDPPVLTFDELHTLPVPDDTAVVALLLTDASDHALILHRGEVREVTLLLCGPAFWNEVYGHTDERVIEWFNAFNARGRAARALADTRTLPADELGAGQEVLKQAEQRFRGVLDEIAASHGAFKTARDASYGLAFRLTQGEEHGFAQRVAELHWRRTVSTELALLREHLWPTLTEALDPAVKHVLLMPMGSSAVMPLHAAAPSHLTVGYIPSLGTWRLCRERATQSETRSLLAVTPLDGTSDGSSNAAFSVLEARWLAARWMALGRPASVLIGPGASRDATLGAAPDRSLFHFSGHARYDWEEPRRSWIRCSDAVLTLADIQASMDLATSRLVTLSACETGVSSADFGEEFIGLPAALLQAGAPTVVATLWPVSFSATALLLDRFYELWLGREHEISIASALKVAARWLSTATKEELLARLESRPLEEEGITPNAVDKIMSQLQDPPFSDPYYWAAFAAYGAVF